MGFYLSKLLEQEKWGLRKKYIFRNSFTHEQTYTIYAEFIKIETNQVGITLSLGVIFPNYFHKYIWL